jgi:hypothetical protein
MAASGLLPLDSPRWGHLAHAYGPADDVPGWLAALERGDDRDEKPGDDDGVWHEIWSALCHQGTVYTATYAAVPHLLATALCRPVDERFSLLQFIAAAAASRDAAPVPADLAAAYASAIAMTRSVAPASLTAGLDRDDAIWMLVVIADLSGQRAVSGLLQELADGEMGVECPECAEYLVVTAGALPFTARLETPGTPTTTARHTPPRAAIAELAALARSATLDDVAREVAAVECEVPCPACGDVFSLVDSHTPSEE